MEDSQIELVAREFSLTVGEERERQRFEALALETMGVLTAAGEESFAACRPYPCSAFNFCQQRWLHDRVEPGLLARWFAWKADYAALLARNPKLELANFMQSVSETHDSSSFPYGWEDLVWHWVVNGHADKPPFDDRHEIVDQAFLDRMGKLRAAIGGWLMWSEVATRVVFVSEAEWLPICDARAAKRATERARWAVRGSTCS